MPNPNIKAFHLLSDDKYIITMQQPESLLVSSKSDSQDSLLSPLHQENQSQTQQNQFEEHEEEEQEHENRRYESSKKRKRECGDEAFRVKTPRKLSIKCYDPPEPPRKPKASPATKRRAMWVKRSVVFLDVAKEVQSMFPPSVLQDFGKQIKKPIS